MKKTVKSHFIYEGNEQTTSRYHLTLTSPPPPPTTRVFGLYDKMIIMDWYMDWGLVWWWCVYCHICLHFHPLPPEYFLHYYLKHVRSISDSVDCSLWWDHVGMDELVHIWQCNSHSCHVAISIVCWVQWMIYHPRGTLRMVIIPLHLPLLSWTLLLL